MCAQHGRYMDAFFLQGISSNFRRGKSRALWRPIRPAPAARINMEIDARTGVQVTEITAAEMALQERIRSAQESAVSEVLLPVPSPDLLQRVIEDADGFAEAATAKHRAPFSPDVACAVGCSYCCYQLVGVSAAEVFRITRYMRDRLLDAQRATVVEHVRQLDKATRGMNSKARLGVKKSCTFLAPDGKCSIYPVRPLACSEFTSFNIQDCKRGKRLGFKQFGVIHEKARMVVFNAVRQGLQDGMAQSLPKVDSKWLELTAAVVAALDTPEAEEKWLDGADFFARSHLNASRQHR